MVTTCSAQADEICGTAGRSSAVGCHVKLICPVDQWSQIFMSFCAGDTQGLSETSKQFPEGVGEAEAGSLNVLSGQRWGWLTASGQQGGVLCWVTGLQLGKHCLGGAVLPTNCRRQLHRHLQGLGCPSPLGPAPGATPVQAHGPKLD